MSAPSLDDVVRSATDLLARNGVQEACDLFTRHFRLALVDGEHAHAVHTLHRQAIFLADCKLFDAANELAECALAVAGARELPRSVTRVTNLLGLLAFRQHRWEPARAWYSNALKLARAQHDDVMSAVVSMNLGAIDNIQGRFHEARLSYLESIASAVRCGERTYLTMTYNNLGMVCADLEEWLEALVYFDRGIETANDLGDERLLATLHANRAEPLIELEEPALAAASLRAAERLAERTGYQPVLSDVERFRARMCRRSRDFEAALQHAERARELADHPDLRLHWAEAVEERGRIFMAWERPGAALGDFRTARRAYLELAAEQDVARIDRCIAEARMAAGEGSGLE